MKNVIVKTPALDITTYFSFISEINLNKDRILLDMTINFMDFLKYIL
jgi:hypothetical protein